jgi:hypothetical protein
MEYAGGGSAATNTTDTTGTCTFVVLTPETSIDQLNLTITVAKDGYQQKQTNIVLNVAPPEPGFPWLIVLMIAIPVAIAVLVLVLVKLKLLVLSSKDEAQG